MKSASIELRKNLILYHRWLGVFFSVLFAMWFVSGIVLMYSPYPGVSSQLRLDRSEPINPGEVSVSLAEAQRLAGLATIDRVRLGMLDGHPVYRFHQGRQQKVVYAHQPVLFTGLTQEAALRVASAWTGLNPENAQFLGARNDEDQWTLNKNVRPLRPFLLFAWPDGQEVYVSQVSGEVMQHTTRADRLGAWFGAIPHWLYFTPLRKETGIWRAVVIALSFAGVWMTLFGIIVGLWLYSPSKRFRFPSGPSSIPYAGWKRWHTVLGLVFGLLTFTWILSGMFSMNPFQWSPEFGPDSELKARLEGAKWSSALFTGEPVGAMLERVSLGPIREVDFAVAAANGVYFLRRDSRHLWRVEPGQPPQTGVSLEWAKAQMEKALPGTPLRESRVVTQYENYYVDRAGKLPLPAYYFEFADVQRSMHYLDAATGRLVESYEPRSRWNRWLYHGLHSWDLPWLYANRPAWDLAVLLPMLGGVALCVTSVWIAWLRVRRKALRWKTASAASAPPTVRYSSSSR
jgi:uncharacterized iron-regulated membrane protein